MKKVLITVVCAIVGAVAFAGEEQTKKVTKPVELTCSNVMEEAKQKLGDKRLFVAFIESDFRSINKMALGFPNFFINEIAGLASCVADSAYDYAKASNLKIVSVPKTRENEKKLQAMHAKQGS